MAESKVDKRFLATMLGMAGLGSSIFGYGAYKRLDPNIKEPLPVATAPQSQAYQFSHPAIEKLLGGIAKAEHRALGDIDHKEYDPRLMVRTGGGGGSSSAYGPYQITRNLTRGLLNNEPALFAPIKDFANNFIAQGSKFLKAKNNDPIYGLGGKGELHGPDHHNAHMQLGDLAIQALTDEKKINYEDGFTPRELDTMIQTWRGASEREDPEYYRIVRSHYFSR